MIWFGSSAGVAISNMYPKAKSVGRWLREGWLIAVVYVFGFFVMLTIIGWHPDAPHKSESIYLLKYLKDDRPALPMGQRELAVCALDRETSPRTSDRRPSFLANEEGFDPVALVSLS